MNDINIGTSGYHYKHWEHVFYPENIKKNDWLNYYSKFFNTVEINASFYQLPSERTINFWYNMTPENFNFSVKGSRYITHNKKLDDVNESVELFINRVFGLKEKLSILLWQFPENFNLDLLKLEKFLKNLKRYNVRSAFEFRNDSWFCDETYSLLKKYNYSLVIADSPRGTTPIVLTADYIYIRFHGGRIIYGSNYSKRELKKWSSLVKGFEDKDLYIYFNNDAKGFAVKNALEIINEMTK